MRTAELTGTHLDYWTARAEGLQVNEYCELLDVREPGGSPVDYHPSTDWLQGGPLIEKHGMTVGREHDGTYWVTIYGEPNVPGSDIGAAGDTPLQAICRAVVRAQFGDTVDDIALPDAG